MTITVQPNPAESGRPITITVTGPGPHYVRVAGSGEDWQQIAIDPDTDQGTWTVTAPGGGSLQISDRQPPVPDSTSVPVDSTD